MGSYSAIALLCSYAKLHNPMPCMQMLPRHTWLVTAAISTANDAGVVSSSAGTCHLANIVKARLGRENAVQPVPAHSAAQCSLCPLPWTPRFFQLTKALPPGPGCLYEGTGRGALDCSGQRPASRAQTWRPGCHRSRPSQTRPACPRPSSPGCAAQHAAFSASPAAGSSRADGSQVHGQKKQTRCRSILAGSPSA